MEYIDLCKYVFKEERVDWGMRNLKDTHRQLATCRQISIYLGHWFFPRITWSDLAKPFNLDRNTARYSNDSILKLSFSDKDLRKRLDKYLIQIRKKIDSTDNIETILEDQDFKLKLIDSINDIETIVDFYCKVKDMKLVKNN